MRIRPELLKIFHFSAIAIALLVAAGPASATYVNFESSHVHPIARTPSGDRLLAVNTPDAVLEVFQVEGDGSLTRERAIPVGLEPVTVVARTDSEAWVVNNLSDTISIVDLAAGHVVRTLRVGDEPTDVVFAQGKAFVAVSQEDAVKIYALSNLNAAPVVVPIFSRDVRALAVANDGSKVYAVTQRSGNQTSVVDANVIFPGGLNLDPNRLAALDLRDIDCLNPPPYPPLPSGINRNPALTDPPNGVPPVALIVKWDAGTGRWIDDAGQDWTACLPYRLPDHDLFIIDAVSHAVSTVRTLGTTLFDVSVHPSGKIYVPNTDARNFVRFEHPLGVQGHVVDSQVSVVDPANANAVTRVDLNAHINRASDPATNLAEREASVSQPGMLVWKSDGSAGYMTAIGSRKLFRVDGSCFSGACVFGPNRANPTAVVVGEGPTGVALDEAHDRLFVLNRISHSLAIVELSTLDLLAEIPLHDPSDLATREGRRFLYDGIDSSAHGDAACASCHISGDLDGLAWDLGDPSGSMTPYSALNDNVRFILPLGNNPTPCPPNLCASHVGFDPQKGPMTTQTLRAMLEPLHWRGDRATMNDFNPAFVGLLGKDDIGPIAGKPAGLSAADMERFRQFSLAMRFPPNPYRNVDDTMPCGRRNVDPGCEIKPHGSLFSGNPTEGEFLFLNNNSDAGQRCSACHALPFGAAGGALGGVNPTEPTTAPQATALFNGDADGSPHSDLEVPHLRNMYEKFGPVWATPAQSPPDTPVGFGFIHDGAIPDMFRFLSASVFTLSAANQAQQVRDISNFMFLFPTGTRPAVGRQVTLPAGVPPTGPAADEALLATLQSLGNVASGVRHCELVATATSSGRQRHWYWSGGAWVTDVAGETPVSTLALRQNAQGPVTFTCATIGAGPRLGGNRDLDAVLDGEDCANDDAGTWRAPQGVGLIDVQGVGPTTIAWNDQSAVTGPSLRFDVLGGLLSVLRATGISATACVASDVAGVDWHDLRADPAPGEGFFYLVRAENPCGTGDLGAGRASIQNLVCGGP